MSDRSRDIVIALIVVQLAGLLCAPAWHRHRDGDEAVSVSFDVATAQSAEAAARAEFGAEGCSVCLTQRLLGQGQIAVPASLVLPDLEAPSLSRLSPLPHLLIGTFFDVRGPPAP